MAVNTTLALSSLTTTSESIDGVLLIWANDTDGCLTYTGQNVAEIWRAATNDRSQASKLAEIEGNSYTDTGFATRQTFYYWVRAKNASGELGPWEPSGATNGTAGTPTTQDPGGVRSDLNVEDGASDGANFNTNLLNIPDRITDNATTGLNITDNFMGYFDGFAWQAFIRDNGDFQFRGDSNNFIAWDGASLNIRGTLTVENPSGVRDDINVENGADVTGNNTSSDTSRVAGSASTTVRDDASEARAFAGNVATSTAFTEINGSAIATGTLLVDSIAKNTTIDGGTNAIDFQSPIITDVAAFSTGIRTNLIQETGFSNILIENRFDNISGDITLKVANPSASVELVGRDSGGGLRTFFTSKADGDTLIGHSNGQLRLRGTGIDAGLSRIARVDDPVSDGDAVNKLWAENNLGGGGSSGFTSITTDSGAALSSDSLSVDLLGGTGISVTEGSANTITINNIADGFGRINTDSGTAFASGPDDNVTLRGGTGMSVTESSNVIEVDNTTDGFGLIGSNSGTAIASGPDDRVDILGGVGITVFENTSNVLTVDNVTDGFGRIVTGGGNVFASGPDDTLTIIGGTDISTRTVSGTILIDFTGSSGNADGFGRINTPSGTAFASGPDDDVTFDNPDGNIEISESGNTIDFGLAFNISVSGDITSGEDISADTFRANSNVPLRGDDGSSLLAFDSVNDTLVLGISAGVDDVEVRGNFSVSGSKNFRIPHPLRKNYDLVHSTVESDTPGENLYRYQIKSAGNRDVETLQIPAYIPALNNNFQVFVSPADNFGSGFGWVENGALYYRTNEAGTYNILLIGTRQDLWDSWKGPEQPSRPKFSFDGPEDERKPQ